MTLKLTIAFCFLLTVSAIPRISYSQLEDVVGEDGVPSGAVYLVERLEELKASPMNLNTASMEDLLILPWIDESTARKIIEKRAELGVFKSLEDLLSVNGVTERQLGLIAPFVTVGRGEASIPTQKEPRTSGKKGIPKKTQGSFRLRTHGDLPISDLNELDCYERFNLTTGNFEAGLLLQKDSFEKRFDDFAAFFVDIHGPEPFGEFIVGDYFLNFGQGLTLWSTGGVFKGDEAVGQARKRGRSAGGFASSSENAPLRGVALSGGDDKARLYAFWSTTYLDATIDTLGRVTSVSSSGRHVTAGELDREDRLHESLAGLRVEFLKERLGMVGTTILLTGYSPPIGFGAVPFIFPVPGAPGFSTRTASPEFLAETDETSPPQSAQSGRRYLPSGLSGHSAFGEDVRPFLGIDFELATAAADFFGEIALGEDSGPSAVLGFGRDLSSAKMSFLLRRFDSRLVNLRSAPFATSGMAGETGGYLGFEAKLPSRIRLSSYLDVSDKTGESYYGKPSVKELMVKAEREMTRSVLLTVRDKYATGANLRNSARVQVDWKMSQRVDFRSRYSNSSYVGDAGEKERGDLFYTGFSFRMKKNEVSFRTVFFDSKSSLSRLYEYEDDLPGMVSVKSLWGRGIRYYIYGKTSFLRTALIVKYSETVYEGRDREREIGLALDGRPFRR